MPKLVEHSQARREGVAVLRNVQAGRPASAAVHEHALPLWPTFNLAESRPSKGCVAPCPVSRPTALPNRAAQDPSPVTTSEEGTADD